MMNYTYIQHQQGFTLLELILVLFILAILTTTSLTFLENEDGQLRYNQSLDKLDLIADALLKERIFQNSTFYSGFVSDNGLIPPQTDLDPLTDNNTTWSDTGGGDEWISFDEITPYYYNPNPTAAEVLLDDTSNPEFNLYKGFRGPYLVTGRDSNNNFFDGWGDPFVIASASNVFDFTFDGNPNKPSPFNVDIARSLEENDWTIAPTALNITIENETGGTGTVSANSYEVAVVIFENDDVDTVTVPQDRWTTFHFTQDTAINDGSTYSSSSGTWEKDGTAVTTESIPVGEHIALLVDLSVGAGSRDGVTEIDDSIRFTVFADVSNQPEIILTVP